MKNNAKLYLSLLLLVLSVLTAGNLGLRANAESATRGAILPVGKAVQIKAAWPASGADSGG